MHINSQISRTPPCLWLGLILSCFLFNGRAEALKEQYQLTDGGRPGAFEVALDEVEVRDASGHHIQTLAAQPSAESLRQRATELKTSTGGEVGLVLYEAGKKHTPYTRRVVTHDILLHVASDKDASTATNGLSGVTLRKISYAPGYFVVEATDSATALAQADSVRKQPGVLSAETQLARLPTKYYSPNDPYLSIEWHLRNTGINGGLAGIDVNLSGTWNTYRGHGINIGIVDDGLQYTHPDLAANYSAVLSTNVNDHNADPAPDVTVDHHGTAVAGVAAAVGNNNQGVCGVAPEATLAGIRLLGGDANLSYEDVANAFTWRNDAIFVKNNSWGFVGLTPLGPLVEGALADSAQNGRNGKGTIFVFASGNGLQEGDDANYAAMQNSIYTIPVAALNDQGNQADYSNPGACLVVTAPSGDDYRQGIVTTDLTGDDGYNYIGANDLANPSFSRWFAGTSASAPVVSGVVALILQANPNLGWRDVQEILIRTATKCSPADSDWVTNSAGFHFNHKFGAGLINTDAAVNLASHWTNLAPATVVSVSKNNLSTPIPDNDLNGTTFTFNISNDLPLLRAEQVTLTADISHQSRGELAITLTSPSGVVSRLAEQHYDPEADWPGWTFSTRRDWGESSTGTWTVRIADGKAGLVGTVNSLTLNINGIAVMPVPGFTGSPVRGVLPLSVTFTNLSIRATDYFWDFGDGKTSTDANPVNVYDSGGIYTVKLSAIGNGITNTFTRTNYVTVTNPLPPTITITTPTASQRWSNDVFTARGTAHGVFGASGSVYYQLNGGAWTGVDTTNGWTNWFADMELVPGTNTLRFYAEDIIGAHSATNTVNFFYALGTPLVVQTSGSGTLSPNDNGQLLEIGRTYSITATPAVGFVFSNWTGGIDAPTDLLTNKPAVTFLMQSNLTLLATFVDTQRPTVTIGKPTAGQRITNDVFTATGTAADNGAVQQVMYSFNGADWQAADGTTNWSTDVALVPGTNVLRAFSVDTYGNNSLTSSASFFSVVPAVITVQTNGHGILSPNYNGQSLEVGRSYTMTATAGIGFILTNWSSNLGFPPGTVTNKAALTFIMQSNLVLTATFVDGQRPTVAITKPIASQRITNNVFTATGTATDNGQIEQVLYSLNGADWQIANGTTNWSADLAIVPGSNTFKAYSVDDYGNGSLTSSVSLFSVVPALITVQTNGRGTLTPNYNGQMLEIGRGYTMTATAGTGFVLTNWSSNLGFPAGTVTNKPALTFLMQSNLALTATFVDVQRPTIIVTKPIASQRITNNVFTATGTATDNGTVQQIWYSLNGADWSTATGTTNWSVDLAIVPGSNTFKAYSVDDYGNGSLTSSVSLFSVVPALITVQTNGRGTLTPNYNGQMLEIGRGYTMTATAGTGFVLTNWSSNLGFPAGTVTNKPALTFLMQSNLALTATFVDIQRPTIIVTKPTASQRITNNVFTATGTAADNGTVQQIWHSLNGADWSIAIGTTNWSADLAIIPGSNTFKAFSVDAYGNNSLTSSVSLFSVVPALITVQTNGRGTLSPNYNGQMLEIGRAYTMTATPGIGFVLTNWSSNLGFPAGTVTNKPALTFLMQSNLALTATFVDIQRPTIIVTKPTASQRITNNVFTALGTAADNGQIQQVLYSLNNADWAVANGTTNWSIDLAIVPGSNSFRAYSMDTYGNDSLTSSVSLFSVVTAQLTVQTNGRGTISPNYNGQMLEIGRLYSMTATPATGFVLTNWNSVTTPVSGPILSGSVTDSGLTSKPVSGVTPLDEKTSFPVLTQLTNKPTLTFLMESNLVLLANFVDVQRPTLTITKPIANQRITNSVFTATGTATDNDQVQQVLYSLNGADWQNADSSNIDLTLTPGTNIFRAYSVDAYGNSSLTSSVTFFSVVTSPITVTTNGLGTITPNYNGQLMEVGRGYTMTATAGANFVFSNWTGGVISRTAALSFVMESNLVLQANFITNPFTSPGIYIGLMYDTNGVTHQSSGYFTATTTTKGGYTGNLSVGGASYPFTGQFYADGTASNSVARIGTNALSMQLEWDLAGGKIMTGVVSDGHWISELAANRSTFNATTNPAPQAGKYTLLLPGGVDSLAQPGGDGYGTLTIGTAGQITFSGKLGDGTVFLQSTTLSDDAQWPFYQSVYSGKGSIIGWLSFSNQSGSDITGAVSWSKLPQAGVYYPTGFVVEAEAAGSVYVTPPVGTRVLNFSTGGLRLANGNLATGFTNVVNVTSNNIVQNLSTNVMSLTINSALGTFTGSATDPVSHRVLTLNGVLLQKQAFGAGCFLGTNQAGRVYFGP